MLTDGSEKRREAELLWPLIEHQSKSFIGKRAAAYRRQGIDRESAALMAATDFKELIKLN